MNNKLKIKDRKLAMLAGQAGFTLIELVIVIIISSIMIVTLAIQQSRWSDRLAVSTQTYDMALAIRQAQIYSLGVREYPGAVGDKFNIGYGIHIQMDQPSQYIFFADKDNNDKYDSGEAIETKALTRGVTIYKICDVESSGSESCSTTNGNIRRLGISFFRPEPKADILFLNNGGNPTPFANNKKAAIYLRSAGNKEYKITVEASGYVSITQT